MRGDVDMRSGYACCHQPGGQDTGKHCSGEAPGRWSAHNHGQYSTMEMVRRSSAHARPLTRTGPKLFVSSPTITGPALARADALLHHDAGDVELAVGELQEEDQRLPRAHPGGAQGLGPDNRRLATNGGLSPLWQRRDSLVVLLDVRANAAIQRFPGPMAGLGREVFPRSVRV